MPGVSVGIVLGNPTTMKMSATNALADARAPLYDQKVGCRMGREVRYGMGSALSLRDSMAASAKLVPTPITARLAHRQDQMWHGSSTCTG
jgi:hypothetical protein